MYTTDLIHSAYVEQPQQAALELIVEEKFLVFGRLLLHIYVFSDIWCHLYVAKIVVALLEIHYLTWKVGYIKV